MVCYVCLAEVPAMVRVGCISFEGNALARTRNSVLILRGNWEEMREKRE